MSSTKELHYQNILSAFPGKWELVSKISDTIEPLLKVFGVPWLVRKAVLLATPSVAVVFIPETPATETPSVNSSEASLYPSLDIKQPSYSPCIIQFTTNAGPKTIVLPLDLSGKECDNVEQNGEVSKMTSKVEGGVVKTTRISPTGTFFEQREVVNHSTETKYGPMLRVSVEVTVTATKEQIRVVRWFKRL